MAQTTHLTRTQIYLTVDQQSTLAAMARVQGSTSSAVIRLAIDEFIAAHRPASKAARRLSAAGAWSSDTSRPTLRDLRAEERSF